MLKRLLVMLSCLLCLLGSSALAAEIQLPPINHQSFYCQDNAGILGEKARAINQLGQELHAKSGAQLAVVTVDSLQGRDIKEYANALFRNLKLGSKEKNNGTLLLVAVQDRKVRIEVGYGLEGALPDGLCGRIRDTYLIPAFKEQDYKGGVSKAYEQMALLIAKEANVELSIGGKTELNTELAEKPQEEDTWEDWLLMGLGAVAMLVFVGVFVYIFGGMLLGLVNWLLGLVGLGPIFPSWAASLQDKNSNKNDDDDWHGGGGFGGGDSGDSGDSGDGGDSGGGGSDGGW